MSGRRPSWISDTRRIRPLAEEEVPQVGAVLGLARLHQGDGFYLVAWEGNEPVGHAHLALTNPPELQDVSVRAEHRRRGVASALTAAGERESNGRGFDRLRITVSVENEPAQALYRGCGYVDAGIPPKRVQGTIVIRTGPLEVDDTLLTWEKRLTISSKRLRCAPAQDGIRRSNMARFRNSVTRLLGRRPKSAGDGQGDAVDRKETKRLNAEYTGSFARNAGQELGILPPRYGRK